jgi:hypothetical protein
MSSFGVPAGSQSGNQLVSVSSTRTVVRSDRPTRVYELRFWANSDLKAATVKLTFEGQAISGGAAIPLPLLQTRVGEGTPTTATVYVFRPERPFLWSGEMPIEFEGSTAFSCLIVGEPVPAR